MPLRRCSSPAPPELVVIVGIQYLVIFRAVEDSSGLHTAAEVLTLTFGANVFTNG